MIGTLAAARNCNLSKSSLNGLRCECVSDAYLRKPQIPEEDAAVTIVVENSRLYWAAEFSITLVYRIVVE